MDKIDFKIEWDDEKNHVLSIFINNINFIEIIKKYEMQFDNKIAGKYSGLLVNYFEDIDLVKHFMGNYDDDNILNYTGKTQVLECTCHEAGCWPFNLKIYSNNEVIYWADYEQPHRKKDSKGGFWDYSNLKKMEFNKLEYENKLMEISKQIQNILK